MINVLCNCFNLLRKEHLATVGVVLETQNKQCTNTLLLYMILFWSLDHNIFPIDDTRTYGKIRICMDHPQSHIHVG